MDNPDLNDFILNVSGFDVSVSPLGLDVYYFIKEDFMIIFYPTAAGEAVDVIGNALRVEKKLMFFSIVDVVKALQQLRE